MRQLPAARHERRGRAKPLRADGQLTLRIYNKTINEIRVYTLQDNFKSPQEPTPDMTCTTYGIEDFDVQYWDGSQWVTVPGGHVTGNDRVMRVFTFPEVTTSKILVIVNNGRAHFSRIVEVEAFGCPAP